MTPHPSTPGPECTGPDSWLWHGPGATGVSL